MGGGGLYGDLRAGVWRQETTSFPYVATTSDFPPWSPQAGPVIRYPSYWTTGLCPEHRAVDREPAEPTGSGLPASSSAPHIATSANGENLSGPQEEFSRLPLRVSHCFATFHGPVTARGVDLSCWVWCGIPSAWRSPTTRCPGGNIPSRPSAEFARLAPGAARGDPRGG
jgi:hypothetical protein